jgi:hypothetical protein
MANMATVSASYQQLRIKRNLQETKKPAHPGKTMPERPAQTLHFISPSEERFMFLRFGLTSRWKPFSMMGEAHYERTIITW